MNGLEEGSDCSLFLIGKKGETASGCLRCLCHIVYKLSAVPLMARSCEIQNRGKLQSMSDITEHDICLDTGG